MKYPKLQELYTSREMIDVFKGYNHNLRIGEGEFYEMTNLTSSDYPVLSPRTQRGVYHNAVSKPQGLIAKDDLCYVDNGRWYINGVDPIEDTEMDLTVECNSCPFKTTCESYKNNGICKKTMISMGAYIIIMPDKKYINTADYSDYGNIEAEKTTEGTVNFTLCKLDGSEFDAVASATPPPKVPANKYWIDTSENPPVLKQYSTTQLTYTSVATTYIKISSPGIGKAFSENDGITISGIEIEALKDLNNTMVIWAKGDDYIIVTGMLAKVTSTDTPITIKRKMPNMDFIIESENRLWGCRYGEALNGEIVNEIYASKLGDFKNWNCFAGISTDSYVATVGTDGEFTGAISHFGYPLFFKENCMHKIYGNYPANFQIQTTACRGVQNGCSKSLAIVNETLFYKSRSGICAYDGSLPVEVSSALGDENYSDAVAGVLGNKYYISMRDTRHEYSLFVFDTLKNMWHREDSTQAVDFCSFQGNLYYIDHEDNQIKAVVGDGSPETVSIDTSRVKWSAITGIIGTDSPDKKYISRLDVRLLLQVGSSVVFSAEYDSSGEWEHLFTMTGTTLKSFSVPIRPKRCDHMRLRIDGAGDAKIYSICKTIEQGSDV